MLDSLHFTRLIMIFIQHVSSRSDREHGSNTPVLHCCDSRLVHRCALGRTPHTSVGNGNGRRIASCSFEHTEMRIADCRRKLSNLQENCAIGSVFDSSEETNRCLGLINKKLFRVTRPYLMGGGGMTTNKMFSGQNKNGKCQFNFDCFIPSISTLKS